MKRLFNPQHELGRVLIGLRQLFVQVAGFSLAINLLMLAPTLYMLQIYDRVLASRNGMTLAMLTVMVVGLYALMGSLEWVRARLLIRIGVRLDHLLNERVFSAAFERHLRRQGANPAQAMQDLAHTRQFLAGTGALAFFDAPWTPIYLIVISILHPLLGLFSLAAAILLFALTWLNEMLTHKPLAQANREALAAQAFANNNLRNAEAIAAMGMLPAIRGRWAARQARVLGLQVLASDRGGSIGAITKFVRLTAQSLILGAGAWLALDNEVTPGAMIAGSILMGRALAPVELVISAWKQWVSASAAHERLSELLQRFPAPAPTMPLPVPRGAITVDNVSAVPPGATAPVLRHLAFRVGAGDVVAVMGPSAAGKSSLARLLVGLWPAASGHVRLDGADVFAWNKDELGPHIGYLPQDIELMEGTVAENIARFGPPDGEKIVAAARLAGVHDMILHLAKGYETQVGADGDALSGGQRQRIALARALYGEPCLVVLDEPNSNLDEAGETAVLAALDALSARGCTVVFISHGPNLLAAAQKLLVLQHGTLLAYGPRDQVLAHLSSKGPQLLSAAGGHAP
ncbi:MAG: type I secretion system permease/ATPase [Rhodocyclaceae bacterium]|nr:type I secretion system permease/ATPase [Rhodocyclaceae bacterium]